MNQTSMLAAAASAALFAGLAVGPAFAAAPGGDIVALEAAWSRAMVAHDVAAIKTIVAPDWHGQNPSGPMSDRAKLLADITGGHDKVSKMTNHDVKVRYVGGVAIAQGMDNEISSHDGKSTSGEYSWTDVFEKRGGHWVAVASQVTKVMK